MVPVWIALTTPINASFIPFLSSGPPTTNSPRRLVRVSLFSFSLSISAMRSDARSLWSPRRSSSPSTCLMVATSFASASISLLRSPGCFLINSSSLSFIAIARLSASILFFARAAPLASPARTPVPANAACACFVLWASLACIDSSLPLALAIISSISPRLLIAACSADNASSRRDCCCLRKLLYRDISSCLIACICSKLAAAISPCSLSGAKTSSNSAAVKPSAAASLSFFVTSLRTSLSIFLGSNPAASKILLTLTPSSPGATANAFRALFFPVVNSLFVSATIPTCFWASPLSFGGR